MKPISLKPFLNKRVEITRIPLTVDDPRTVRGRLSYKKSDPYGYFRIDNTAYCSFRVTSIKLAPAISVEILDAQE
jgi:hypothetical protein